jgi:outer membrane protein OmpA-like peptidoglycan-associated protein
MSKKFLYLASILLTIIVGTVLYWFFCCGSGGKDKDAEAAGADTSTAPEEQVAEPVAPEPDPSPAVDWQAVRDRINDNPLSPTFEPYKTERAIGQDDINKVDEIKEYLANNADGSVLVTGHTDISGPRELNMRLSRERADFLQGVLVQHGIDAGKITTDFKGPDEPIADNSTPEGRAKNRRAVVFIK